MYVFSKEWKSLAVYKAIKAKSKYSQWGANTFIHFAISFPSTITNCNRSHDRWPIKKR